LAAGVAGVGLGDDLAQCEPAAVPTPERFEDRLGAGERLEAAAVAAAADGPGLVDRYVADLACGTGGAVVEAAVKDGPRAATLT
jgi:hypothetical protein